MWHHLVLEVQGAPVATVTIDHGVKRALKQLVKLDVLLDGKSIFHSESKAALRDDSSIEPLAKESELANVDHHARL